MCRMLILLHGIRYPALQPREGALSSPNPVERLRSSPIDKPRSRGAFHQAPPPTAAAWSSPRAWRNERPVRPLTQFTDLGLAKPILRALASSGYETPTPIQAQAIPSVMQGRDLLGIAQTGTGKTAAFALPILHRLSENRKPAPRRGARCVVLSPTRELATQIAESFRTYGAHLGMTVTVIFGGAKYGPQIKALTTGVDILVATPGRLIDHLGEKTADLSSTEILVLDEADQMLDLGFLQPIRRIVSGMSKNRQNLFFSATMPTEIGKLAGELLVNPVSVSVAPAATTVERIEQKLLFIEAPRKRALLAELFADAAITAPSSSPAPSAAPTACRSIWTRLASSPPRSTVTRPRASASAPWRPSRPVRSAR